MTTNNRRFITLLVIGENHTELVKRFSEDTKTEKYLFARLDDAQKLLDKKIQYVESMVNNEKIPLTDQQRELYSLMLEDYKEMDDFDYFREYTIGCTYDENGDAWKDINPNARYRYEKCPQKLLMNHGEESAFSNPFKLKDGGLSYITTVGEVDWPQMHMYNTKLYERAWEIVVEGSQPQDATEERIAFSMGNRRAYFDNFDDKDDYVKRSCSFWTYGVVSEGGYEECDYSHSDKEWVKGFFDRFVKPLPQDTVVAIYEACLI